MEGAEQMEKLELLKQWIADSDNIVFFGGAGVSTESGIPDSEVWTGCIIRNMIIPPETILSHNFLYGKDRRILPVLPG